MHHIHVHVYAVAIESMDRKFEKNYCEIDKKVAAAAILII
jgi:hypothetical protein